MSKIKNNFSSSAHQNQVYGIHAVYALLSQSPEKVQCIFVQSDRHDVRFQDILQLTQHYHIPVEKNPQLFTSLSHTQGVIAQCIPSQTASLNLPTLLSSLSTPPLLLILDGVQDPHNLGACLRTANAAGAHAIIIPKDRAAPLTAAARKVACGAAEFTPVITVTNLAQTLRFLKEAGIWLYGLASEAKYSLYTERFTHPTAFILGAEEEGLRRLTREHCDVLLSIPLYGQMESLNVSVATGICLFEAARQRHV